MKKQKAARSLSRWREHAKEEEVINTEPPPPLIHSPGRFGNRAKKGAASKGAVKAASHFSTRKRTGRTRGNLQIREKAEASLLAEARLARAEHVGAFVLKVEEIYAELSETQPMVTSGDLGHAMELLGRPAPAAALARAKTKQRPDPRKHMTAGDFVSLAVSVEECRAEAFDDACRTQKAKLLTLEEEEVCRVVGDRRSWLRNVELFEPVDAYVQLFDGIIMMFLIFVFIFLPVELAFDEVADRRDVWTLGLVVDVVFCLDVIKNFNVGYFIPGSGREILVMDRQAVARRYFTSWFFIDFCSSVPISQILEASIGESGGAMLSGKKALKMLKLARLTKLLKLVRATQFIQRLRIFVLQILDDYGIRISDAVFKLTRLMLIVLVLAHWLGCMAYMLCRLYGFPTESWVVASGLVDKRGNHRKPVAARYSWSVYKILATFVATAFAEPGVSQACMKVTGWCRIESWITLLCLYIGTVFFAMLVSNMATIIANANVGSRTFEEKLNTALEYMRMRRFPRTTMDRVKDYYYVRFLGGKFFDEHGILENLNPELRKEISLFNTRTIRPKTPILRNSPDRFFATIAIHLRLTSFFDNDIVFTEGAATDAMYFISNGFCEILLRAAQNNAVRVLASGCYFGEVATLLGVKRTATVRAQGQLELYALGPSHLVNACSDFPEVGAYLREVALNRMTMLRQFDASADIDACIGEDYVDSEDAMTPLYRTYMARQMQRHSYVATSKPKTVAGRMRSMAASTLRDSLLARRASSDAGENPNGVSGNLVAAAKASAVKFKTGRETRGGAPNGKKSMLPDHGWLRPPERVQGAGLEIAASGGPGSPQASPGRRIQVAPSPPA